MELEEIQEQEFELSEARHRELLDALKKFTKSEPVKLDTSAIDKLCSNIQAYINKVEPQKEYSPSVNVETNQKEVVQSLGEMNRSILSALNGLKDLVQIQNNPKTWEFSVKRNGYTQFIESIKAVQK